MSVNTPLPVDIQAALKSLDSSLHHKNNDWDALLVSARNIINSLERSSFFDDPKQREQKVYTVEVLQRLAYHDVDAGGVADVADWSLERWLQLHQTYPEDVAVSKGEPYLTMLI